MSNNSDKITYSIADEHLQIAHKIAHFLANEQQRIEPGKEGISTELSKLVNYLDSKIKQNLHLDKSERKPSKIFTYIERLAEYGKTIGHSNKTTIYYKSINEVCNQYLRFYEKKPLLMIQILGWSQRLMRYYKIVDRNDEPNISPIAQTKSITVKTPQIAETPKVAKPIKTEDSKPSKPVLPKVIKPIKTEDSKGLERPPKPWERPHKKPSQ
ncbi:hypothetical protein VB735_24520 [Halotia wernerae UHCC 0503]|nr:hypothetical protein [Halotia wernerae UHCC 0503]